MPDTKRTQAHYEVPMLRHALHVLEALADAGEPLRLQDLADRTHVSKSSVFRILATFEREGYVERADDGVRVRLGARLVDLAACVDTAGGVERVARPFLEALHERFGETVNLGALRGRQLIYADVLESGHPFRIAAHVGATAPLHASALGKAILATHPEPYVAALLGSAPLAAYTGRTVTDPDRVRASLAAVRRRGFATDDEEIERGASCVAAAIPGPGGVATHGISVSGPTARMAERRDQIVPAVVDACRTVAARMPIGGARRRGGR